MNYYEHHIGDYAQSTSHLSLIEDGVYSRLIRKYLATEKPLPPDPIAIQRLIGARTDEERCVVIAILEEFFSLDTDGWHNTFCDEKIAKYHAGRSEREQKKTHERDRLQRHRAERSRLFSELRNFGITPKWDTSVTKLREMLEQTCNAPETFQVVAGSLQGVSAATAEENSPKICAEIAQKLGRTTPDTVPGGGKLTPATPPETLQTAEGIQQTPRSYCITEDSESLQRTCNAPATACNAPATANQEPITNNQYISYISIDSADGNVSGGVAGATKKTATSPRRSIQLPDNFLPNSDHQILANSLGINLETEIGAFRDHHQARGSLMKNWDAALRLWLRNAKKFSSAGHKPKFDALAYVNKNRREFYDERGDNIYIGSCWTDNLDPNQPLV